MPTIVISICIFSLLDSISVALNYSQLIILYSTLVWPLSWRSVWKKAALALFRLRPLPLWVSTDWLAFANRGFEQEVGKGIVHSTDDHMKLSPFTDTIQRQAEQNKKMNWSFRAPWHLCFCLIWITCTCTYSIIWNSDRVYATTKVLSHPSLLYI